MSLFKELKRRQVFKVGVAYLVTSWLIIQVTDTIGPILTLPNAFAKGVLLLLAIGFPVALVAAWVYEITPEGVRVDRKNPRDRTATHGPDRKLNFVIIGALFLTVTVLILDRVVWTETDLPYTRDDIAQQSIAVLPFVNVSNDLEQEYFSDGLSEELLNLLAQIPELRVTSRTSAFSFKGKETRISDVGLALGVDHVLEGSVRRSDNRIRITAQLIHAPSDTRIWSDTWDREFKDVFVIQDEIAKYVVDAMKVQLLGAVPRSVETTQEAYDLFLQASFLMTQGTATGFRQAEALNQQALEIDSDYAPAWTQRAILYFNGASFGTWETAEAARLAKNAAQEAVRLFGESAWAHAILARIAISHDFDYELAAQELETALELGPDDAEVLNTAAEFELRQGNLEKSIRYIERMTAIDPLANDRSEFAQVFFYSGRKAEGIRLWKDAIERRPLAEFLRKSLALSLLETGDVDGALAAIAGEPAEGHRQQGLALIYETMGDRERSTEALNQLLAEPSRWTFELAEVYSFRGELDAAFEWMNRAIARHDLGLRHTMYSPYLDNMRRDPRFEDVLSRLGLSSDP